MFRLIFNRMNPLNGVVNFFKWNQSFKKIELKLKSKFKGGYDINLLLMDRMPDFIDIEQYSKSIPVLIKNVTDGRMWIYGKDYKGLPKLTVLNEEVYNNLPFATAYPKGHPKKISIFSLSPAMYNDIASREGHIHVGLSRRISRRYQSFKNDRPDFESLLQKTFKMVAYIIGTYIVGYGVNQYLEINKKLSDVGMNVKKQTLENTAKLKEVQPYLYLTTSLLESDVIEHGKNQQELTQIINKLEYSNNELFNLEEQLNNVFLLKIPPFSHAKTPIFERLEYLKKTIAVQLIQLKSSRKFDEAKWLHKSGQYAFALRIIDEVCNEIDDIDRMGSEKSIKENLLFELIDMKIPVLNVQAKLHACLMHATEDATDKKRHFDECEKSYLMAKNLSESSGREDTINHAFLLSGLAYLYDAQGEPEKALDFQKRALIINPISDVILCGMGMHLYNIELKKKKFNFEKLDEAYAYFSKAIALNPKKGIANIYNVRGKLRMDMHDEKGALKDFKAALAINPQIRGTSIKIAQLLSKQEQPNEAEKYYALELVMDPTKIETTRSKMHKFEAENNLEHNKVSQKMILHLYDEGMLSDRNEAKFLTNSVIHRKI